VDSNFENENNATEGAHVEEVQLFIGNKTL
jgi:hypothetical protein